MKFEQIAEGVYTRYYEKAKYTCLVCKKPWIHGLSVLYASNLQNYSYESHNTNLKIWIPILEMVCKKKNVKLEILDWTSPYSICSPKCFEEFIKGYEADMVITLIEEDIKNGNI